MKRATIGTALIAFLLLLSSSATSNQGLAAAGAGRYVSSTFFGLSVDGLNVAHSWPLSVPLGTLGKTEGTEWNWLEPSNGTYDWTPLDNSIAFAKAAGVTTFVYTFWSTPEWASSAPTQSCILTPIEGVTGCAAPPSHIGDWDSFVKAVVTRYTGQIQYFELWNEANLVETWSGNVTQMLVLAQHAYNDIKTVDSNAVVLAPSSSRVGILPYSNGCNPAECWLAEYLQAGGGEYADGFAFHPYACLRNDTACAQLGIGCPQSKIQICAGTPLVTQIEGIRSVLAAYGLSNKPLLSTEGGFPSDIIGPGLLGTAEEQAAYVSRWFVIQASENISTAIWFSEFRPQGGLFGFGTTSALSEINRGYEQTYSWLVGSTMDGPCSLLSSGVWSCSLTLAGGEEALMVFADSGETPVSYSPPTGYTEYQALNGSTYPVGGLLDVGMEPILLTPQMTSSTTSASNASSGMTSSSAGVPEFPFQLLAAAASLLMVVASYLIIRRHSLSRQKSALRNSTRS